MKKKVNRVTSPMAIMTTVSLFSKPCSCFTVRPLYKSPLYADSVDSDPDVKLYHREQDKVEGKPPSGLNSGGALCCGYRQIGEHRPHVDTPHDQNYESSYRLDYPQPGIGWLKLTVCLHIAFCSRARKGSFRAASTKWASIVRAIIGPPIWAM